MQVLYAGRIGIWSVEGGKMEYQEKNPLEEAWTSSTLNPHTVCMTGVTIKHGPHWWKQALLSLCHPCSPASESSLLTLLIISKIHNLLHPLLWYTAVHHLMNPTPNNWDYQVSKMLRAMESLTYILWTTSLHFFPPDLVKEAWKWSYNALDQKTALLQPL